MANNATDISKPAESSSGGPDDLAELDALVSDLADEMNEAADEIARVMGGVEDAPSSQAESAQDDALARTAEDLDAQEALDVEGIDQALERVAAELEADLDTASAREEDPADVRADDPAEEAIAAQIDAELAREESERAAVEGEAPAQDESPADAEATEEAVHAVAEAIDRLLDEETAEATSVDPAPQARETGGVEADEAGTAEDGDEAEREEALGDESDVPAPPAKAPIPASEPKKKPAVKPSTTTAPAPPSTKGPARVLVGALVLVNAPFSKVPTGLRDTLGLVGLVTLFNAACLWVFLLLR